MVVGEPGGITVTGWGFAPEEGVLLTLYGPGVNGLVVAGGNADEIGTFTLSTPTGRSGFSLDDVTALEAGVGYVMAEGSAGSKTGAPITFLEAVK